MSRSVRMTAAILALCVSTAHADWVSLRNGEHLRGIDLRKHRKGYRFTLETGEVVYLPKDDVFHVEKSPRNEKVEFRGKKVTLRHQIEVLLKESKRRLERRSKDVEAWARAAALAPKRFAKPGADAARPPEGSRKPVGTKTPKAVRADDVIRVVKATPKRPDNGRRLQRPEAPGSAPGRRREAGERTPVTKTPVKTAPSSVIEAGLEARDRVLALQHDERIDVFLHTLRHSKLPGARKFASNRLDARGKSRVVRGLVRAALLDGYRPVRDRSLASLKRIADRSTAKVLAQGLTHQRPSVRTRAANAISLFPDRAVVPQILGSIHMTWQGFGRAHMLQVTQRAYIADYELVSGGTGFSIIEVADPVIATNLEGVALDVKVRKVELTARLRALHKITGQNFGADIGAWWERNGDH